MPSFFSSSIICLLALSNAPVPPADKKEKAQEKKPKLTIIAKVPGYQIATKMPGSFDHILHLHSTMQQYPNIIRHLNLTKEECQKLDKIVQNHNHELNKLIEAALPTANPNTFKELEKKYQPIYTEAESKYITVLGKSRIRRAKQLEYWDTTIDLLSREPAVKKQLGITDDQAKKIQDAMAPHQLRARELAAIDDFSSKVWMDLQPMLLEQSRKVEQKILSAKQLQKLNALRGKKPESKQ